MFWFNQILQGVLLGGYYALLASGLSFLFGVMRIINLAHGSLVVLSAFIMMAISQALGVSLLGGLVLMLPAMALVGIGLQFFIFEPSRRGGALVPLLATFGVSLILDNVLFSIFGADTRSFASDIGALSYDSWNIGGIYIGQLACLIFAVALFVLVGVQLLMSYTQIGRQIRATAEDEDAARLSGVNTRLVYAVTSALAMLMVGLAGAALGANDSFAPYAGGSQLIYAFESVIIGGTGSLWGTLMGGIVLGVAQGLGGAINTHLSQIAGHAVFLVVLIARLYRGGEISIYLRRIFLRFA